MCSSVVWGMGYAPRVGYRVLNRCAYTPIHRVTY